MVDEVDVGASDALRAMRAVDAGGTRVLLVRDGDTVRALGAACPHAGAPLEEGVLRDGRILCPWHKAGFCARTGAVLDPPAVDALPAYPARVVAGRILVVPKPIAAEAPATAPDRRRFVIVGGGAAGAVAAQTLRVEGFGGELVLLDAEGRVPYDRTVLSKYHLSGEKGGEKTPLQSQAWWREHRVERRAASVARVDPAARRVVCADGSTLGYDALLLATGAVPAAPGLPGAHLDGVFTLRGRDDADAILRAAERATRAAVLGASFIGMEVAASLRERGLDVTVIGREAVPFARQVGEAIGGAMRSLHERRGVTFRLGATIASIEGGRAVEAVRLANGACIAADLVVAGFGVRPAPPPINGIAPHEDGGLRVDASMRVADSLYAAGDIAHFPLFGDGEPIRVEHWRVAQQHGRVAARAMAGDPGTRFAAVPVFWTIQYLKRLDVIGHATEWDDIVLRGDLGTPEFLAFFVLAGRVVATAGMGRDREIAASLALLEERRDWSAEALEAEIGRMIA